MVWVSRLLLYAIISVFLSHIPIHIAVGVARMAIILPEMLKRVKLTKYLNVLLLKLNRIKVFKAVCISHRV